MKTQTKLVQNLKVAIAKFLKLVQLGVKKYIIQLADTENQLETALNKQLNVLARLVDENVYQQSERLRKLIQPVANKNEMVLGKIDTFINFSTLIYKRVLDRRQQWKDTQLGKIEIDAKGQVTLSLRYKGITVVPDLETAFVKFEEYYQNTVLKYA